MKVETKFPVKFEKIEDIDDRFMKFKIWVVNVDAPNYNGSYFSEESIVKALPSIYNTPVLGFIREDMLGNKDFAGHETELIIKDGELKEHYLGHAYGVIPINCNPRFEYKENEFGLQKYLTVEALIWTKFDDAVDILNRDGVKSQSMELSNNFTGRFREDGLFEFEDFQFFGCAILGEGVNPAIPSSTIEQVFSTQKRKFESTEFTSEYAHIIEKYFASKEVTNGVKLEELLQKYSISVEELAEKGINTEEYSIEELEEKLKEVFESQDNGESENGDKKEPSLDNTQDEEGDDDIKEEGQDQETTHSVKDGDEGQGDNQKEFTLSFELSHDDIRGMLYGKLEDYDVYIVEVFDSYIIVHNWEDNKFYKVSYSKSDNNVDISGDFVEVFSMYLTAEEKSALELMRANFEKYEEENARLKEFEAKVLAEKRNQEIEQLFARPEFSILTEKDLSEVKENMDKFSVKELESKLYEVLGRKNAIKFSKQEKEPNKVNIVINEDLDKPKSSYSHILEKYGLKE